MDDLNSVRIWLSANATQVIIGVLVVLLASSPIVFVKKVRQWLWKLLKWLWAGMLCLPTCLKDGLRRACGFSTLREVQRYGVKFYLTPQAWRHLGTRDPASLADSTINDLVYGPFCIQCHQSLVRPVREPLSMEDTVFHVCSYCLRSWTNVDKTVLLLDCKRRLWNGLDAEKRQTGKIAPS